MADGALCMLLRTKQAAWPSCRRRASQAPPSTAYVGCGAVRGHLSAGRQHGLRQEAQAEAEQTAVKQTEVNQTAGRERERKEKEQLKKEDPQYGGEKTTIVVTKTPDRHSCGRCSAEENA